MAHTNTFYDESKAKQYMDENTYMNQYIFHVPGNGSTPCYVDDPHIRLEKWGGNRWTNNLYINEQLNNRYRRYSRCKNDYTLENMRENIEGNCDKVEYPTCRTFETQQSRAVLPAWTLRDSTAHQFYERQFPLKDHQAELPLNVEAKLVRPEWTRNTFKDIYIRNKEI